MIKEKKNKVTFHKPKSEVNLSHIVDGDRKQWGESPEVEITTQHQRGR